MTTRPVSDGLTINSFLYVFCLLLLLLLFLLRLDQYLLLGGYCPFRLHFCTHRRATLQIVSSYETARRIA